MTAPAQLTCSYATLVNDVAFAAFGLLPTSTDVITDGVATGNQPAQITRCIRKGLQWVYGSYRWSFLRPKIAFSTYPAYTTDTITVDADGNVTLNGGVTPADGGFPSYVASAGGLMIIQTAVPPTFYSGSWLVAASPAPTGTTLKLTGYTGPVFATGIPYTLAFNVYPMPTGYDSFEGEITFPPAWNQRRRPIRRVDQIDIRRRLQNDAVPRKPEMYALFTEGFDPTAGSTRYFSFWPIPDQEYPLEVTGTWQPAMLDASNKYPLGGTVLASVITEACLAAAERDIDNIDGNDPRAVHSRQAMIELQAAVQRDKEYAAPDTLGVDKGHPRVTEGVVHRRQTESTYWYNGGYTGWM
jgi:hypothetical protein